jgi:hypothetical protein
MSGQIKLKAATLGGDITLSPTDTASNLVVTIPAGTSTLVTNATLPAQLNATGSAPIYACRAWVNFNGTGTVAIRESGNVTSITDNGTGNYTVNFTTAMSDANYCVSGACRGQNDTDTNSTVFGSGVITTTTARVYVKNNANSVVDSSAVNVAIFR